MSITRCEKCEKVIDMDIEDTETIGDDIYCLDCYNYEEDKFMAQFERPE